jgi:hypothetical protein
MTTDDITVHQGAALVYAIKSRLLDPWASATIDQVSAYMAEYPPFREVVDYVAGHYEPVTDRSGHAVWQHDPCGSIVVNEGYDLTGAVMPCGLCTTAGPYNRLYVEVK